MKVLAGWLEAIQVLSLQLVVLKILYMYKVEAQKYCFVRAQKVDISNGLWSLCWKLNSYKFKCMSHHNLRIHVSCWWGGIYIYVFRMDGQPCQLCNQTPVIHVQPANWLHNQASGWLISPLRTVTGRDLVIPIRNWTNPDIQSIRINQPCYTTRQPALHPNV